MLTVLIVWFRINFQLGRLQQWADWAAVTSEANVSQLSVAREEGLSRDSTWRRVVTWPGKSHLKVTSSNCTLGSTPTPLSLPFSSTQSKWSPSFLSKGWKFIRFWSNPQINFVWSWITFGIGCECSNLTNQRVPRLYRNFARLNLRYPFVGNYDGYKIIRQSVCMFATHF